MNKNYSSFPMTHADACRRISAVCACVYDLTLDKICDRPFLCTFDQVYAWACEFVRDHELGYDSVYDYEDAEMDWDEHVNWFFLSKLENAYYDTGGMLKDKSVDKEIQ